MQGGRCHFWVHDDNDSDEYDNGGWKMQRSIYIQNKPTSLYISQCLSPYKYKYNFDGPYGKLYFNIHNLHIEITIYTNIYVLFAICWLDFNKLIRMQ